MIPRAFNSGVSLKKAAPILSFADGCKLRYASRSAQPFSHGFSYPVIRSYPFPSPRLLSTETRAAIDQAVASKEVVLFMKGTPELPQCGFSRASIQILGLQGVDPSKFAAFNVLEDDQLRQGE